MKKLASTLICILAVISTYTVSANMLSDKHNPTLTKNQSNLTTDPFADDPFFQSQHNMTRQIRAMQEAMDQLMRNQFSAINGIANNIAPQPFGSDANVKIEEKDNKLIYKIKLPKTTDNKINVSVKNENLVLNLNSTEKISRQQDGSKSITYSQSNYNQSFKLPSEYDSKSMKTNIKDSNLIVIFQKKSQLERAKNTSNAL